LCGSNKENAAYSYTPQLSYNMSFEVVEVHSQVPAPVEVVEPKVPGPIVPIGTL
jgi:hypothetical protein